MNSKSEQARLYGQLGQEQTLEQSQAANRLTAELIETAADNFDLSISQCIHSLVSQVRQHRGIDYEAARKIVVNLLEVETK